MFSWTTAGLLMAFVVLSVEKNETEERLNTLVCVEVNHNSSETSCEAPDKPFNGGYRCASDTDVVGHRYNTGDIIRYYCNRGHRLIGQVNRTCNGTSNQWEPEEPYCQPEYIGHLMQRLNGIEDKVNGIEYQMRVIEQRITSVEKSTLQVGHNVSDMKNKVLAIDDNVLAIYNMSITEFVKWHIIRNRDRLSDCTDITKPIDVDTVTKCMTMQLGVRNGHSVSVFTWVIEDFNHKVPQSLQVAYFSSIFYQTVPGYKLWLRIYIYWDSNIDISLYLLPGEYDDQLTWPFKQNHDLTVVTNNGTEVLHKSFSRQNSTCHLDRPTSAVEFKCENFDSEWANGWQAKNHVLNDGSVIIKLYMYN